MHVFHDFRIPFAFSNSAGMVYMRFLLRLTSTLGKLMRRMNKKRTHKSFAILLAEPVLLSWGIRVEQSMCYLQIISIPASDIEQTQTNVRYGVDS